MTVKKKGFSIIFTQLVPLCSIPTNERGGPWIYPQIEFKWNVEKWSTLCDLRHANCGKLNGQAKPQAAEAQELKREIQREWRVTRAAAAAADNQSPHRRVWIRMQVRCLLIMWLGLSLVLLLLTVPVSEARRGRGRGRTKSRVQIGLPITGKYRDPESDQYYNNNNVSLKESSSVGCVIKRYNLVMDRGPRFCRPRTSISSMCWATRLHSCAWPRVIRVLI